MDAHLFDATQRRRPFQRLNYTPPQCLADLVTPLGIAPGVFATLPLFARSSTAHAGATWLQQIIDEEVKR